MLALIVNVLGAEVNADEIAEVLCADRVGSNGYTEETFQGHLEAIKEHGDGYLTFLKNMASQPAMASMYGFVVMNGPAGVYGLIQSMGQAGILDKKQVASAAKISTTKVARERAWYRKLWDEIGTEGANYMDNWFKENLESLRERYPELGDVEDIKGFLEIAGKSTLMTGVGKHYVEQTDHEATYALGWRVDAHSKARNGGWDPEKGEYTQKYLDKQNKSSDDDDDSEDDGDDDSSNE